MGDDKKQSRIATLVILVAKSSKLIKLLKFVKLLKFSKLLITFSTMFLSVLVYSFLSSPWFAVGFVLVMFVHEMGHVIALKMKGFKASPPIFIPLIGAVIFAPRSMDREQEAFIGYGGPLAGTFISIVLLVVWALMPTHPQIVLMISFVSLYLNLFNMVPVRPLDGGRVTQAVGSWLKYLGIGILFVIPFFSKDAGMMLLWILILGEIKLDYKNRIAIGLACQIAMITLILMGYGEKHLWLNIVDITIASMINLSYFSAGRYDNIDQNNLPKLAFKSRLKWGLLYFALTIIIVGLMVLELKFLVLPDKL